MEDDEKLRSISTLPVGYKSYGRVPVAVYEGTLGVAEDQTTEPTTPLTASYESQRQWWNNVPNLRLPAPGRLRLTASERKLPKSNYDKYLQDRDTQDNSECQNEASFSPVTTGHNNWLITAPSLSENGRTRTNLLPSSPSPSRQIFNGLPVMTPTRRSNLHSSSCANDISSRSNLARSGDQGSDLEVISEHQQPSEFGKPGVTDCPLWKRRAGLPGTAIADETVLPHALKRAISEKLRPRLVPHSPFVQRIVEPIIPLSGHQPGSSHAVSPFILHDSERSASLVSNSIRFPQNRAIAHNAESSSILTMPSGYPCAGYPVYCLKGHTALAIGPDGEYKSGTPVMALDLCQSSADSWALDLHTAIAGNPAYSQEGSSPFDGNVQEAMLNIDGSQDPNPALDISWPALTTAELDSFCPLDGTFEELRSVYSNDLRSTMSLQIRSNPTAVSNRFPISSPRPYIPPSVAGTSIHGGESVGTRPVSQVTGFIERPCAMLSRQRRPLDPKAQPYTMIAQPYIPPHLRAVARAPEEKHELPVDTYNGVHQSLPHPIYGEHLRPNKTEEGSVVNAKRRAYGSGRKDSVPLEPVASAPVWMQHDHPYSWKRRLATGETMSVITIEAFGLLAVLDPVTYSLPYGVC